MTATASTSVSPATKRRATRRESGKPMTTRLAALLCERLMKKERRSCGMGFLAQAKINPHPWMRVDRRVECLGRHPGFHRRRQFDGQLAEETLRAAAAAVCHVPDRGKYAQRLSFQFDLAAFLREHGIAARCQLAADLIVVVRVVAHQDFRH